MSSKGESPPSQRVPITVAIESGVVAIESRSSRLSSGVVAIESRGRRDRVRSRRDRVPGSSRSSPKSSRSSPKSTRLSPGVVAIESKVDAIEHKVDAIESKVDAIESKVVAIESGAVAIEPEVDKPKSSGINGVRERHRVRALMTRPSPGLRPPSPGGRGISAEVSARHHSHREPSPSGRRCAKRG